MRSETLSFKLVFFNGCDDKIYVTRYLICIYPGLVISVFPSARGETSKKSYKMEG